MRTLGISVSACAILASLIWAFVDPGFEPIITLLFGVGGLALSSNYKKEGAASFTVTEPLIKGGSFKGGRINNCQISTKLKVANKKLTKITITSIKLEPSSRIQECFTNFSQEAKTQEISNIAKSTHLPIEIDPDSYILLNISLSASYTEPDQYKQAAAIGRLENEESLVILVEYEAVKGKETFTTVLNIPTTEFLSSARRRYEENNDWKGVVHLIEGV